MSRQSVQVRKPADCCADLYSVDLLGFLQDLEKMVQQARRESVKADDLVRSLTPRPNWHKLDAFAAPPTDSTPHTISPQAPSQTKAHGPGPAPAPPAPQAGGAHQQQGGAALSASTRHLVDRLAAERKQALLRLAELEPLQEQLQQAQRLLEPEAGPTCMQLQLVEPSAPQSLTPALDSEAPPVTQASSAVSTAATGVAPLPARSSAPGTAPHAGKATGTSTTAKAATSSGPSSSGVFSSAAGSEPVGAADTPAVVGLGWRNSVPRFLRWDAPVVLQPYTLESLYSTLQDIWAGKAAFDGQRQALCPLQDFLWTYFRAAHGEQQALVAQAGYSFLYALQQHQHHLATAAVFLRIIEGRWQEAHWHDCRHMLDAVAVVLEALSKLYACPVLAAQCKAYQSRKFVAPSSCCVLCDITYNCRVPVCTVYERPQHGAAGQLLSASSQEHYYSGSVLRLCAKFIRSWLCFATGCHTRKD